ncbi:neutral zinc metallopeptidase [Herbidospora sp. RD11066]
MRRILIPALALSLVAAAPADPRLTGNVLYKTGVIPRSACAEKPVEKRNDVKAAKAYVTFLVGCLDRVWSKQLAKAGIRFTKPRLKLLTKNPARYCGWKWEKGAYDDYCESDKEILVVLGRTLLDVDPDDLWIWTAVSSRYGEHVQYLTGIQRATDKAWPDDEAAQNEVLRRVFLQTYCLTGAFTASVFRSTPRRLSEWKYIVGEWTTIESKEAGSAENIAHWMNRGFNTRDPKNCNTWTAPTRLVA